MRVFLMASVLSYALIFFSGCVATTGKDIIKGPEISTSSQKQESKKGEEFPKTIAVLPFVNKTKADEAFSIVRRTIFNHLASSNYRFLHLKDVDSRLKAAGISSPEELSKFSHDELKNIVGTDGLIIGEITHYDRVFAGIYAQVSVGLKLTLINPQGKTIWEIEDIERHHGGGVSLTPTGLILAAVSAAMQIREIELYRTADDLGRRLARNIPEPEGLSAQKPLKIIQVVHDGAGKTLKFGDSLNVAMEAEPGKEAFVKVKGLGLIPLHEKEPGMYSGQITISPDANIHDTPLVGVLQDDTGTQLEWVCPLGYVNIDNTPPKTVVSLQTLPNDGKITLKWDTSDKDIKEFDILAANSRFGNFEKLVSVTENKFEQKDVNNFTTYHYQVIATDHAGNRSQAAFISGMAVPDERILSATKLSGSIPEQITGVVTLNAEGSPYTIRRETTITPDATLFIEPGAEIILGKSGLLNVQGELQAYGNAKSPVVAKGSGTESFKTFLLLNSDKPIILRGITITGGELPVIVTNGSPEFQGSSIINSVYSAMEIRGISSPIISNSLISGSNSGGILISDKSQPVFHKTTFKNNKPFHIQSSSPYVIDAKDNTWEPKASPMSVLGNVTYK